MRLLMEVEVGDGYTYSCTVTYPIVHESPEAALCELEELVMAAAVNNEFFVFSGHELSYDAFVFVNGEDLEFFAPTLYTLDEYFKYVEKQ